MNKLKSISQEWLLVDNYFGTKQFIIIKKEGVFEKIDFSVIDKIDITKERLEEFIKKEEEIIREKYNGKITIENSFDSGEFKENEKVITFTKKRINYKYFNFIKPYLKECGFYEVFFSTLPNTSIIFDCSKYKIIVMPMMDFEE